MGYLNQNCLFGRLTPEIIDQCQPYACSKDADIDSFFHNGTKDNYEDYRNEMMAYSHCFYTDVEQYNKEHPKEHVRPEMVCAFSLSNTALRTAPLPKPKRNLFNRTIPNAKRRSQYPAILIGQLCVFDNFNHLHIGGEVIDLIKTMAIDGNRDFAARYLLVDAVNIPKVLSFYQGNGFQFMFETEEEELECLHKSPDCGCPTRMMFFDLIVLRDDA